MRLLAFLLAALLSLSAASCSQTRTANAQTLSPPTLAPLVRQVAPAVVSIAIKGRVAMAQNPLFNDPFFRQFFGIPQGPIEREIQAAGSGVIIDPREGLIVTNAHVVEHADQIEVTLSDGRTLMAHKIGADPTSDVALIQVPTGGLSTIPMGNSDALQVGDYVIAIGNPFGIGQTVTHGIISAVHRTGVGDDSRENFIQTDAAINPGNSGGALVDMKGALVGINTAIIGPSGGNVGIGFAIPVNAVRRVVASLLRRSTADRRR
ncbi:MAG TPA: trypsin-like peptidase domain-containing protein [Reyranella sp.]|jgi:serine protease Do/serine protease DegQ|nr:trypsin-like peptidase domain-containing protein [Reyranella sp.]